MAIGYGSNFALPALPQEQVGKNIIPKKSGLIGIFRILLTIAEIGVAFTGIGAVAETAAGLAFGAANQALDEQSGSTSVVGTFLNFGAPLIGGAFVGRQNLKQVNKIGREIIGDAEGVSARQLRSVVSQVEGGTTFQFFNKGERFSKKVYENIKTGRSLIKQLGAQGFNFGLKGADNVAREVFEDEQFYRSVGFTTDEIRKIKNILARSLGQIDATRGLEELGELFRDIERTTQSVGVKQFMKDFRKGMKVIKKAKVDIPEASIIYRTLQDAAEKHGVRYGNKLVEQAEGSWLKRSWKKVNSAWFNDHVVQKAQLIDPNDMGRAPIEWLYQKIKKKIGKYFKNIEKLDDAFEKTGGINLDSRWLRGYKIITDTPIKKLIMITFRPGPSYSKRAVLVWATNHQIKELITKSPGRTYQKYWALSKGGKAIGISSLFGGLSFAPTTSGGSSLMVNSILSFIPVPALKNILSIVSNWVENTHDMATGEYSKNWVEKFTGSMERSTISRTFRLAGKSVGGGLATQSFGAAVGRFVGAELQRVGTQIFATGIKNAIAGKDFSKGLKQKAIHGALVSVRSNALRKLRHKRGSSSVVVSTLTARRKLRQVKRIPNAVVAGRPFKGFKI